MSESVSSDACNRTHTAIEKEFLSVGKMLDAHTVSITSMEGLLVRLTVLQEIAMENQKTQNLALERIDNRVLDRTQENEKKFFESAPGLLIIKGGFLLLAIIIFAAIGQSVNPDFVTKIFGK